MISRYYFSGKSKRIVIILSIDLNERIIKINLTFNSWKVEPFRRLTSSDTTGCLVN